DAPAGELGDELGRRWQSERLAHARARTMEQRAVLGDHPVEHTDFRKYPDQLVELAARDEQKLATRCGAAPECGYRLRRDPPVHGERAIVIDCQRSEAHGVAVSRGTRRAATLLSAPRSYTERAFHSAPHLFELG